MRAGTGRTGAAMRLGLAVTGVPTIVLFSSRFDSCVPLDIPFDFMNFDFLCPQCDLYLTVQSVVFLFKIG